MKKISVSFHDPLVKNNFNNLPISRQTFSEKANLNNAIFTLNNPNADWHVIGTWNDNIDDIIGKKILYMQQEPPEIKLPNEYILNHCKVALTYLKLDHKIFQVYTPPALQWTYDISAKLIPGRGHVYEKLNNNYLTDFLFAPIPNKEKKCSIIMSSKNMVIGHKRRVNFLDRLKKKFSDQIDIYGFGYNPIKNKRDAIDPYHYSIALENSRINNWWTEKIADVFLGYSCPIYYGCENINDFFDKGALVNIDIEEENQALDIIEKAIENTQLINMANIIEARRTILLDYNMMSLIILAINRFENENSNQ